MKALSIVIAVMLLLAAIGVQTSRLWIEQDEHELTRRDLAAAQQKAADYKAEAEYRHIQGAAQTILGEACLAREQAAAEDAALRAAIMDTAPPVPVTPEQEKQGVNRETRRAAADYLNRPL